MGQAPWTLPQPLWLCHTCRLQLQDKMADVEHRLEELQQAIERRLEEQGSLLMQQAGLEKDAAALTQVEVVQGMLPSVLLVSPCLGLVLQSKSSLIALCPIRPQSEYHGWLGPASFVTSHLWRGPLCQMELQMRSH